jgi:hypothetical protein
MMAFMVRAQWPHSALQYSSKTPNLRCRLGDRRAAKFNAEGKFRMGWTLVQELCPQLDRIVSIAAFDVVRFSKEAKAGQ